MAQKSTRRTFLQVAGASGALALAGCTSTSGNQNGDGSGDGGSGNDSDGGSGDGSSDTSALTADGSSTVYPITSQGASVWNSNPPADDKEYWGPGQYGIDTDEAMADYWANLYGFSAEGSGPPFRVNIGLSHSGTGVEKVKNGQVDIGDSSAPVADELPDAKQSTLKKFKDHVVGVDGQPVVVSKEIYDAGVKKLTGKQLKQIYKGKIKNWSEIDSYSGGGRKIQAVGRAEGSGTDTAFRANLFGNSNAKIPGVDVRKGQNQKVKTLVEKSDNAIAYMALAFVDEKKVPPIALELDGTTYEYGKNLGAKEYPLSRDLHCYTWKETSKKEAAFLNMLLSEYGQKMFVEPNNYFVLPKDRRKEERDKLPSQSS